LHERAVGAEVLAPAQLSGECESFLGEVQAPAKKLFERRAAPRVLFCSWNELRKATCAAARKSQYLCSDGEAAAQWRLAMTSSKQKKRVA